MFVIISSSTPLYVKITDEEKVDLVDDIRVASKFIGADVLTYYLDVSRKRYNNIDLKCLDVPNEIFGNEPKNIIDSLNDEQFMQVMKKYHE